MLHLRFLTAGSVAAAVALTAFFIGPFTTQRVHAAEIIESLKSSAWNALRVQIKNVDADGILIDGEVEVRFCAPHTLAGLAGTISAAAHSDEPRAADHALENISQDIKSVFVDLSVVAGPDAEEDAVGLDLSVRGGVTLPDTAWTYLQLRRLPDEVMREAPQAALITSFFQRGILLDVPSIEGLTGMFDDEGETGAKVDVSATPVAQLKVDIDASADASVKVKQGGDHGAAAAGTHAALVRTHESALHAHDSVYKSHRKALAFGHSSDDAPADAAGGQVRIGAEAQSDGVGISVDIETRDEADQGGGSERDQVLFGLEQLDRFLSGGLSPAELESLFSEISDGEVNAQVVQREAGLHVLMIRDFEPEDEFVRNAVIEIGYRESIGIEWLAIRNLGRQNGEITIDFVDGGPDRAVSVRAEMIDNGVQRMDVNQLGAFIHSFMQ